MYLNDWFQLSKEERSVIRCTWKNVNENEKNCFSEWGKNIRQLKDNFLILFPVSVTAAALDTHLTPESRTFFMHLIEISIQMLC